jgi:flagellar hook assembly protein FlgD
MNGKQRILWKGTDKNGNEVKSGSYIIRLESGSPPRSLGGSGRKTVSRTVELIK